MLIFFTYFHFKVITAIREFMQAIEGYNKNPRFNNDSKEKLKILQIKMCETEDLRSMLILLLRHFNPKYHSKQYLQVWNIYTKYLDKFPRLLSTSKDCLKEISTER